MSEPFVAFVNEGTGANLPILITSTGSVQAIPVNGTDVMISVRTNAVYWRWGKADTSISTGTAATQGHWLPQNFVGRFGKPAAATHIIILQDTAAAQVFITSGRGI